jgi:hypothetical protein
MPQDYNRMSPKEFGAIVKSILEEKLSVGNGKSPRAHHRHLYDHIDTEAILKQKDQIVKQYKNT